MFNADGSFTYTPTDDFYGTGSFSYKLLGGTWPRDPGVPLSEDSAIVTVEIAVNPVNDEPSFTKGGDQEVLENAGPQSVPGWANFLAGPPNESDQMVLAYHVIGNSNPGLFAAGPLVTSDGTLTYTPAQDASGTAAVTLTVQDTGGTANGGDDTSAGLSFVITVVPRLKILTLALPNATEGEEYSQSVLVSGGVGPYTWDIIEIEGHSEYALPEGLSLNSSTGLISGTPTTASAAGSTFRIRVKDSAGTEVTQDLCIHVDESTAGPLTVTPAPDTGQATIEAIASTLAGEGVEIGDVSFAGAAAAVGTFTGGFPATGLSGGVILSSGAVANIGGANDSDAITEVNNTSGDQDLDSLIATNSTLDAAVLEFEFTVTDPNATAVTFEYVFASEEYNEYANTVYNDVFGFFMEGPDFLRANLALVPGTNTPVSINNVNGGRPFGSPNAINPGYYVNNDPDDGGTQPLLSLVQADGLTKVLTVQATIVPGLTYRMKLAIADAGDRQFDSWVLIKAKSLSAVCPIIP